MRGPEGHSGLVTHPQRHVFQWLQLLPINEVEFSAKEVKVLVAGVHVCLRSHENDAVKVMNVDMNKDPEETTQDLLADLDEVLGEGDTYTGGEDVLVVYLDFDPVHQQAHVLGGRQGRWPLVLVVVLPAVLVPRAPRHHGAALLCAELTHGPIDEVDAVEEVHHVHGYPVVEVLSVGELHGSPQVHPGVEGSLGLLVELEPLRAWLKLALGPEGPVLVEDLFEGDGHVDGDLGMGEGDEEDGGAGEQLGLVSRPRRPRGGQTGTNSTSGSRSSQEAGDEASHSTCVMVALGHPLLNNPRVLYVINVNPARFQIRFPHREFPYPAPI